MTLKSPFETTEVAVLEPCVTVKRNEDCQGEPAGEITDGFGSAKGTGPVTAVSGSRFYRFATMQAVDFIVKETNRLLLDGSPVDNVLQWICQRSSEKLGCPTVWIGTCERDGSIRVRAEQSPDPVSLSSISIRWDDSPEGRGPAGIAVRTGLPQRARFFRDATLKAWESHARSHDFRVVYAIPLTCNGSTIGIAGFHCDSDHHLDEIQPVLDSFADHIALTILHGMQRDTIGLQTTVLESMATGVAVCDLNGVIEWVNPAFATIAGLSQHDLMGVNWAFGNHGLGPEEPEHVKQAVTSGQILERERTYRRDDQSTYQVSELIVPVQTGNSVTKIVAIHNDITEKRRHEEEVRRMTRSDLLTGLPNRQVLEEELERRVSGQPGKTTALLLLDLDQFRVVNDTLGHTTGDRMLIAISGLLANTISNDDFLARWGGDEFAILMTGNEGGLLEERARMIQARLGDDRLTFGGKTFSAGCSVGMALARGQTRPKDVLALADTALYEAKDEGAGHFVVLDGESSGIQNQLRNSGQYATLVRDAVRDNRFEVHYQPIVDLKTEARHCVEALVRMRSDTDQLVEPGAFIPVAERYGLMPQVDLCVVRQVLDRLRGSGKHKVFMNFSGSVLSDEHYCALIEAELRRRDLDSTSVVIEITEQVAVRDLGKARRWMMKMREAGCTFALDDFGTGFSTFSYLKALPVDYVKIDSSFVSTMLTDPASKAMVHAIVTVCRTLDKIVIAEGVENEKTARALTELGVDLGQGFYWGFPRSNGLTN